MADPTVDISSMPPPPPDGSPLLSTQDVSQSADISGMPSPETMFTQQVGRAPEPAELAHWKTNPEDFAGGQQFAPSAGAQTMGAVKGMAGLGEATLSQATGATSGVVGGFLAHVGTLLATQDPEAAKAVRDSVSSALTYSPRSTAGQAINDVPSQVVTAAFKAAHGPQAVAAVDTAARAQFGDAVVDPIKAGLGMAGEAAMAVPGAGMLASAVGKTAGVAERAGARVLSSFKDPEAVTPAPAAAPPKLTPGPITAESLKTEPNRLATPAPAAPAEAAGAPGAAPAAPTEAVGAPGAAPAAPTEAAGAPGAAPAAPAPAPAKATPAADALAAHNSTAAQQPWYGMSFEEIQQHPNLWNQRSAWNNKLDTLTAAAQQESRRALVDRLTAGAVQGETLAQTSARLKANDAAAPGAAPAAPAPAPAKAPPAPRFTAPDQPGPPSAAPHPVTQITRQNALQHLNEDSGGQLPEVRTSALTGDYTESGHDFQHAKSPDAGGARMSDVIAGENNALKVASQKTTDPAITGGQAAGVDQAALAQRGETIDKALSGIGDWFDKNISDTYKQADAAAGGRPITNFSNTQKLLGDPTNFVGTQEGEALHRGAVARAQSLGLIGQDGAWKPATVQQAEQFRTWAGQQYTPRTGRMIGALKDAVDSDVETHGGPGLYEQGRALRTQRDQMLEGPSGISKLMANDKTGINRPVPLEQIPDNIVKMPKEQFDHVVNVLHDSAKLGNGELAEGSAAALNEIRGHMAARLHEAGSTGRDGMWDPYKYHERLNAYSLKMPSVFSPEGIDRFKTINEAGNALRMDKRYPGASAQAQVHAGMGIRERAGNLGTSMAEDLIPMGNTLGEISGASQKVRDLLKGSGGKKHLKEVEGRITKLGERPGATPNTPEGVTPAPNNTPENVSPLGQRLGGASQRGGRSSPQKRGQNL